MSVWQTVLGISVGFLAGYAMSNVIGYIHIEKTVKYVLERIKND